MSSVCCRISIWSLNKAFVNGFRPNVLKLPRELFEGIEMPDNNDLFDTNIPSLKPMAERNRQRISKVKKSCLYVIAIFQFRLRNTTAKLPHELIKFITDMMYSQRFEDITVSDPPMIYKIAKNLREILFPTKVETDEQKFNKSQMTARERALGIRPKRFVEDDSSDEDSAFDRDNNIIIIKEEDKFEKEMEEVKFAKN